MKKSLNHSKKYAIFDFIKKSAASNVDKEAIKTFIATFREKLIVNKRSQSGKDSYRLITIINDPRTFEDQHIVSPDEKTVCFTK